MSEKNSKKCSACGTGYVNHHILYALSFLEETLGRYGEFFFSFTIKKNPEKITSFFEKCFFSILNFAGILKFSEDKERALTGRSKLVWEEAERRGIKMEQLVVWGKPIEHYRAKIRERYFYFQSLPIPSEMRQNGYRWIDDKFMLFEKLSKHDLPVPKTKKAKTWGETVKAFRDMQKPVIIKPSLGSRGRHTTTNINTEAELLKAYKLVNQISLSWVVQEHLSGSVCRATVIENKLVGFFKADPPQITGDGKNSIQELIKIKNLSKEDGVSPIEINEDVLDFLKRLGLELNSILEKDRTINLSAKTGRLYGGLTEEILPKVHPKMHGIFQKAGELMEAPVVGFDLIIENPEEDPEKSRWGIIECNSLPFIDLHYLHSKDQK